MSARCIVTRWLPAAHDLTILIPPTRAGDERQREKRRRRREARRSRVPPLAWRVGRRASCRRRLLPSSKQWSRPARLLLAPAPRMLLARGERLTPELGDARLRARKEERAAGVGDDRRRARVAWKAAPTSSPLLSADAAARQAGIARRCTTPHPLRSSSSRALRRSLCALEAEASRVG
jgi:hypothetical protein